MALSAQQLALLEKTFRERGFVRVPMSALADGIGFTRRALYHHFSNKEEAFRAAVLFGNLRGMEAGRVAANEALARGETAIDVVHAFLDARFGDTRRMVARSRYVHELNDTVFRLCRDIVEDVAVKLHAELADVLKKLQARKKMQLKPDVTFADLARMLAAGVRGVNQTPPLPKESEYAPRYREIVKAVLRGSAKLTPE